MSDFDFISESALRTNINHAYELILELVLLTESKQYQERQSIVSSFRKTIIIHTAAIIEALLLWKLKKMFSEGDVEIEDEWEFKDIHLIFKQEKSSEEVVWCRRKKVKKKVSRLDFLHISRLLQKHSVLRGEKLIDDIDTVRVYRNNLHIGSLTQLDREYKPYDLEFCFSVLERVKKILTESQ